VETDASFRQGFRRMEVPTGETKAESDGPPLRKMGGN